MEFLARGTQWFVYFYTFCPITFHLSIISTSQFSLTDHDFSRTLLIWIDRQFGIQRPPGLYRYLLKKKGLKNVTSKDPKP